MNLRNDLQQFLHVTNNVNLYFRVTSSLLSRHLCVRSRGGLTLETCYLLTVEMWPYQLVWYWIFLTSFHSCSSCTIILGCHGSQFLSSPEWCHVQWTCDLDRKCSQFMPRNKVKLGSLRLQVPGYWCNFECSIKCNQEALGWKWAKGNVGQRIHVIWNTFDLIFEVGGGMRWIWKKKKKSFTVWL